MKVNEIFRSLQGESSYMGLPCIFVRLTGCNLNCSYCDTNYAKTEGEDMTVEEVFQMVMAFAKKGDILEITGGEPLLQVDEVNELIKKIRKELPYSLIDDILIETNGSVDISTVKKRWRSNIIIIMDWKSPSSDMSKKMLESNLEKLEEYDELKFVIGNWKDYDEMKRIIEEYKPDCKRLVSTVWDSIKRNDVAEKMLKDGIEARFQIQLHKLIWNKDRRGV